MHYAYYPNPVASHPHNSILQWASEMGLPATLILLILMAHGLLLWVKRFSLTKNQTIISDESFLGIVLFATVCSAFIYSLVDGVIVMPASQILMTIIIGWMLGLYFKANQKSVKTTKNLFLLGFAGIHLIVLTYTVIPDLITRLAGEQTATREHPKIMQPRFWQQGHIPE